ncbi:TPA: type III secretion system inner rod subunit SctI [Escherichia coli]|uniref:type III secretion system inner rod subunit SctI n=1 Tax=Escherichia coli TaxID=562 RepID=UPI000BE29A13|nr:type III secretion system inner rod subunit SctI [Escherichia coli]MBS9316449.1 type III secretion system inner rod subunit SctI [Escherichia coli]MEB5957502.1 type III secretion system inner rod subunit SctI [Escherichia coli]
MSQTLEALTALTKLTPSSATSENNLSIVVHDQNFNNLVSSAFNKISETDVQFKNVINELSQSPRFTSAPQKLLMLQSYLGEYSNYVSLVSTLARKGVSTIETLEKSQ